MRIDKELEKQGFTKKEIKKQLKQGNILLNNQIVNSLSLWVDGQIDILSVNHKEIPLTYHHYYMLYKPKGVVTAKTDKKFPTVHDFVPPHQDLFSVGRLDKDTTGFILMTDNGGLGYYLTQEHTNVSKGYQVTVNGPLSKEDILAFEEGIEFLDGTRCKPASLDIKNTSLYESQAFVTISEGRRHQIKKMFLSRGVKVIQLHRQSIGPLVLDDKLTIGSYRSLTEQELRSLIVLYRGDE